MLRCAGRQASRLISSRIAATAVPILVVKSSLTSQGSSSADLFQLLQHRHQSRSFSSWLAPTPALSAAKTDAGGGSGDFGIATGMELEELEAQQQGKKRFDLDPPRGPFGTKDHPAIVESVFDERIVGCSGGVGEDEHDVTWFKLKKGEDYECPVCTQVFELKVVGEGGLPGAHH
ncbi:unnamed protein product [Calypogeia fissa]